MQTSHIYLCIRAKQNTVGVNEINIPVASQGTVNFRTAVTGYEIQIILSIILNRAPAVNGKVNPFQHVIILRAADHHCICRRVIDRHIRRRSLYIAASQIQLGHHVRKNCERGFIRFSIFKCIIVQIVSAFGTIKLTSYSITSSRCWKRSGNGKTYVASFGFREFLSGNKSCQIPGKCSRNSSPLLDTDFICYQCQFLSRNAVIIDCRIGTGKRIVNRLLTRKRQIFIGYSPIISDIFIIK